MNTTLWLGTAKIDITPERPIPLSGFEDRKGVFASITKRLFARVWLFQQSSVEGIKHRALLVQADLIWWGTEKVESFTNRLKAMWSLDSVILHASHSHSGPQTTAMFTPSLGLLHEEYIDMVEERILQDIAIADQSLEPVEIESGSGSCRIGINRRKFADGEMQMLPNDEGPIDPEVRVFRFLKIDGNAKGVLFHYTCHPTTTRANEVSSEFPGAAMERIEAELGSSVMASFLQGCCGEIRPALYEDGEFLDGTSEHVDELGSLLANEVLDVLKQPMQRLAPQLSGIQHRRAALPMIDLPSAEELQKLTSEEGISAEWSRLLLEHPARLNGTVDLALCWLRIADGLSFLGINGEPVLQYGLTIKALSGGKVLPLGYTNGMIGYIPTEKQLEEGGYESKDSFLYFGLPGPFAPEAEGMIIEQIQALLKEQVSV